MLLHPMSHLPQPPKPLKVLTIDGGGLQAVSTLIILDKLLENIARQNGVPNQKPRPCDIFDVIAGIGAGGWLAILLGRFHLDIASCLAEWYNLMQCLSPKSKADELRMRLLYRCYFDPARLVDQIDKLTRIYGTGEHLYSTGSADTRCQKVFVAALRTDATGAHLGYNLFRSYACPAGAKVLEGPKDPSNYKISRAFAATGAAKYFTPAWKESMATGHRMRFSDTKFPNPHNITELALDEMWGLYGKDVSISVVVNIGPGLPNQSDIKNISQRFSWGLNPAESTRRSMFQRSSKSPATRRQGPGKAAERCQQKCAYDNIQISVSPYDLPHRNRHVTSFGSEHRRIDEKLRRREDEIERDIRKKLKNIYPNATPPYFRLAPAQAPAGTAKNDAESPTIAFDATRKFLESPRVGADMEEASRQISLPFSSAAA